MENNRSKMKSILLEMIDQYLSGKAEAEDVVIWATLKMSEEKFYEIQPEVVDYIVADALGCLMMLSNSEPEEFRSTREELLEVRSYLLGEKSFPPERIPKQEKNI